MWVSHAEVRGRGSFPIDMLRYDECFPSDQASVAAMTGDGREHKVVHVTKFGRTSREASRWTYDRWVSFGWSCRVTSTARM